MLPLCYYILVSLSLMGRYPCVAYVLQYAGVSLGDRSLSMCCLCVTMTAYTTVRQWHSIASDVQQDAAI
jgi:hypothetical protein